MKEEILDENSELKDSLQSLENDYQSLGVEMEFLADEIYEEIPSEEKINKIIEDIELILSNFSACVDDVEKERVTLVKRRIINNLED